MVCTPRNPACGLCPWVKTCMAHTQGHPEAYPVKAPKQARPTRRGVAYWVTRRDGALLLRRRAEKGLLGGMMEVPTSEWREKKWSMTEAKSCAPVKANWKRLNGTVQHTFTHFHLELTVMTAAIENGRGLKGTWCSSDRLSDYALPTVMKKVAQFVNSSDVYSS